MVTIKTERQIIEKNNRLKEFGVNSNYMKEAEKQFFRKWALVEEQKKEFDKWVRKFTFVDYMNPEIDVDDIKELRKVLFGDNKNE